VKFHIRSAERFPNHKRFSNKCAGEKAILKNVDKMHAGCYDMLN